MFTEKKGRFSLTLQGTNKKHFRFSMVFREPSEIRCTVFMGNVNIARFVCSSLFPAKCHAQTCLFYAGKIIQKSNVIIKSNGSCLITQDSCYKNYVLTCAT